MGQICYGIRDEKMRGRLGNANNGQDLRDHGTGVVENRIVATATTKQNYIDAKRVKKVSRSPDKCQKLTIKLPNVLKELRKLKCTGTIMKEDPNNFWVIRMNEDWQNMQEELVEMIQMDLKENKDDTYNDSFGKACDHAKDWAKKLNVEENSYMKTGFLHQLVRLGCILA